MGTVTPLIPERSARKLRPIVKASKQKAPPRPMTTREALVIGLFLVSMLFLILAMGFMLYQANGERFWPLTGEIIPLDQWRPGDQAFFLRLIAVGFGCIGLIALIGITAFGAFLMRAVRSRIARRRETPWQRRERRFQEIIDRLKPSG